MDKEKLSKQIKILSDIQEEEEWHPWQRLHDDSTNSDPDIQNSDITDLHHKEFLSFLLNLERLGILEITHGGIEPERNEQGGTRADENGTINSELSIYFYRNVNLEKLNHYKEKLLRLFKLKEDNENLLKTQTEVVFLHERQLCLHADRTKCYSPQSTTNRIKYLIAIINADGEQISAKKFIKDFNVKTLNPATLISSEVSEINQIISKRFGTDSDFILGKEGYRLNKESYKIVKS